MPFIRSSFLSLGHAVICERPDPLPECYSKQLRSLLLSMLTKSHINRPSIAQVRDVIKRQTAVESSTNNVSYAFDQPFLLRAPPPSSMRLVHSVDNIGLNQESDDYEFKVVGGGKMFEYPVVQEEQQEEVKQEQSPGGMRRYRQPSKGPKANDSYLCNSSRRKNLHNPKGTEVGVPYKCHSCHGFASKVESSHSGSRPSCFPEVPVNNFERLQQDSATPKSERKGTFWKGEVSVSTLDNFSIKQRPDHI